MAETMPQHAERSHAETKTHTVMASLTCGGWWIFKNPSTLQVTNMEVEFTCLIFGKWSSLRGIHVTMDYMFQQVSPGMLGSTIAGEGNALRLGRSFHPNSNQVMDHDGSILQMFGSIHHENSKMKQHHAPFVGSPKKSRESQSKD